jgi:16S rRNA C967 or C1407 C5-methylase (RsmB/RsmF family)
MKAPNALRDWGRKTAAYMSNVQKQMLRTAASCVKEGGIIVYSTCSLEPEEDEEVVDYAVKELGLKAEEIKLAGFKTRPGITSWNERELDKDCSKAIRVYPQDNNTEGFFVAKLRK